MVVGCMAPHMAHGLPQVVKGVGIAHPPEDVAVAKQERWGLRCTVAQDECTDAVALEPLCHLPPFSVHVVPEITSSRADYYSHIVVHFNRS